MTTAVWIWAGAAVLYAAFLGWYVNWKGPMTDVEIDAAVARIRALPELTGDEERLAKMRRFFEKDDGGEFFMVNLLRFFREPVDSPDGSGPKPAPKLLEQYTRPFLGALLKRAGHPAFFGRASGTYVEQWSVEPDPGWSAAGVIRYRSRRDLAAMIGMPEFERVHPYKIAALSHTLAFPTSPAGVVFGPIVWVGLMLALLAAIAHINVR